ncbi:hypothetical protein [Anaeromicropila populeti]|uniref:Uncharacterized protein n=1 Tax=Anaeromicropila populeti TaxID=37658 RepID=A0A1I6LD05_9FIRM|nr:hypothetical protein [Anaeromicropila populeti]SFS01375.1 hypothetical protein SAMN05661086_03227 [Anaeromicropila populeti]
MEIKYVKTKSKSDDNFKDNMGYVSFGDFSCITAERKNTNDPRNYIFVLTDSNEMKYLIGEMNEFSGNEEWGLYTANIYMNYIREYVNGRCFELPDLHDIFVIIASTSSCFEPNKITSKKAMGRLQRWLEASDSESLGLIELINSPRFDYNMVNVE